MLLLGELFIPFSFFLSPPAPDPFSHRFREGISFPNFVESASSKCPSPRSVLCPLLYRTEHFSRGRIGRKGARRRGGRGVANRGGKKEKRTHENRSGSSSTFRLKIAQIRAKPQTKLGMLGNNARNYRTEEIIRNQPCNSTPNMTGRRFHRTMEMIPARPW